MDKKLTKHGNSLALVIDKPILKLLNIDEKTTISLELQDGALIMRPVGAKKRISKDAKMKKLYEDLIKEYGPALKKLAE